MTDDPRALAEDTALWLRGGQLRPNHADCALNLIELLNTALLAALGERDRAVNWRPLEHTDEERERLLEMGKFLVAVEVTKLSGGHWWEIDAVSLDDETGEIVQDTGWSLSDYTHYAPLPAPPAALAQGEG